jgi:tetratricopeptide (TPR) repeat protein
MIEVTVGVVVLVGLGLAWVLWSARRPSSTFRLAHVLPGSGQAEFEEEGRAYIGRAAELETFRKLAVDPDPPPAARRPRRWSRSRPPEEPQRERRPIPLLILVSGPPGMGKHALLRRFAHECHSSRSTPRCGPVINLRDRREIPDVLLQIAECFEKDRHSRGSFVQFGAALERYQRVSGGQRTRGQENLDIVRDFAALGGSVVPASERAAAALSAPATERLLERWEGGSTMTELADAFAADLVALAEQKPRQRLVLLFSDLDSRPTDADTTWLRTWLLPKIATRSILIAASVTADEPDDRRLGGLDRLGPPERMPLKPLTDDEARQFVADVIGLDKGSPQTEMIVARSGGNLDHLQGYRRLIERDAGLRDAETLPADFDAWASTGPTYTLLHDLDSRFLEQVVVASSPLRWFNANLLAKVATEAGLEPEEGKSAQDVVRWGIRPPWIKGRGGGWGIEDPEHRRALLSELRRLDPTLYRAVHRLAARYHHARLAGWGGDTSDEGEPDADFLTDPEGPPDAFNDAEYATTVAEWVYHALAVAPDRGFRLAVRKAAEALFMNPEAAEKLATIDDEITLPPPERIYLDLLARAADALKDRRLSVAIRTLNQLDKAGEPVPLMRPIVRYHLGIASWNGEGDIRTATAYFESAYELLGREALADDRVAMSARCWTATWLAYALANRDGLELAPIRVLDEASALAEQLDDAPLVAELARVKGLIHTHLGNVTAARDSLDMALHAFEQEGKPDAVAVVRRDRGMLFSEMGDDTAAADELEEALGLYASLGNYNARAETHAARVPLHLRAGDEEQAERDIESARRYRPADADIENQIGNGYFSVARYSQAEEFYRAAADRAPDGQIFRRNLASTLHARGKDKEAAELLKALHGENPDEWTVRLFAEVKHACGERRAADRLINDLKAQRLREIRSDPRRAGNHWALGRLAQEWARVLDYAEARAMYREAETAFAKACQLAPDEAGYWLGRGECLLSLGDVRPAVEALQRAVEKGPGRAAIRRALADAIADLPTVSEQLAEIRRALERSPSDANMLSTYAAAIRLLEPAGALAELDLDLKVYPDEPELHFLRAEVLGAGAAAAVQGDGFDYEASGRSTRAAHPSNEAEVLGELEAARRLSGGNGTSKDARLRYLIALAELQVERRAWKAATDCAEEARELAVDDIRLRHLRRRIRYGDAWIRVVDGYDPAVLPVEVVVSEDLLQWMEPPDGQYIYDEMFPAMRAELTERWGVEFPGVRVRANSDLPSGTVAVYLREVPRYSFTVHPLRLAGAAPVRLRELGIEAVDAVRPWDGQAAGWLTTDAIDAVQSAGIRLWDPPGVIVSTVAEIMSRERHDIVTVEAPPALPHRAQSPAPEAAGAEHLKADHASGHRAEALAGLAAD